MVTAMASASSGRDCGEYNTEVQFNFRKLGVGLRRHTKRRRPQKCNPSARAAMRANAGDLNHRAFRRKARGTAGTFQRLGDGAAGRFADRAAILADQEYNRIAVGMWMHTRDKGIAALDPVHQTMVAQKIERAIHRDRRRPRATPQPLHDLVSAERLVAGEQRLQHLPAHRCQPLGARDAEVFGMRDSGAGAAVMIVAGRRKNHCRFCHLGAMNWPDHAVCISAIVATCAVSRKRDGAPDFGPF